MKKIDGSSVRHFVKGACEVLICGLWVAGSFIKAKNEMKPVGYDAAVETIMASSMFGSDKCDAVKLLKRDEDENYYKAVISIMQSSMFGSDKVEMIRYLSQK